MTFHYRKSVRTTSADGKVVEEIIEESDGPVAKMQAEATAMKAERDKESQKVNTFFQRVSAAFTDLFS